MFISRTRQSIGHRNGIILKTLFSSIQKNSVEKNRPMSSLDQFFPSNIHPFFYILTCYIHPLLKKILIFDVKRKSKIVDRYSCAMDTRAIDYPLMFLEKKKKIDKILGI